MSAPESMAATRPDLNATVSASAGSGKTWLLVTRIIRLLLAGAAPGSILALTFTRKAAAEMKIRLRERLYELAVCDDQTLQNSLQDIGAGASAETRQLARSLYETLLHSLYPVRLQTFHSFCQDILSRFSLEADVPPGFELMEDTSLLEQQAWEALFAAATNAPDSELSTDLDQLMQAGDGPANTRKALNSMLSHRSDWWAYTENHRLSADYAGEQLQNQLELTSTTDPVEHFFNQENLNLLGEFAELLGRHKNATNLAHVELISRQLVREPADASTLKILQTAFLTAKNEPRARKHSKAQEKSMTASGEDRFLALHEILCEKILYTLDLLLRQQALCINRAWYRSGHHFIEIFQRLKRELRMLDFQDLEWSCYRLLNTSDNALWVQYKIDQRIDHFLIDEFQDTNPTQWQLLSPLLEEMAAAPEQRWRTAFLVGDEKQSIYSFRRANPALQSQVSDWMHKNLSARATPLDSSWRSSPAIIDFVNGVFQQEPVKALMPGYTEHGTHLKSLPGKVTVFPLYREEEASVQPEPETTLRNSLLQPRTEKILTARTEEAQNITQLIMRLVTTPEAIVKNGQSCAVSYGDIMILMRNRTHIEFYEKALREHKIPFIGSQRGTLLGSLEIQDLEKLLDTLITPFDNLAIAQVLKSPIFAASDEDLMLLAQIHGESHWYERLFLLPDNLDPQHPLVRAAKLLPGWRQLADTIPVHDLLDIIYAEANIMQRYAAAARESSKQRVQANLQRFLELSLELDSGRYPSLSHFLHYLRALSKPDAASPDEPVVNSDDSRVRLMTIHASKGLEAPIVFLADCNSGGSAKDAFTALVHWPANSRTPQRFQLVMGKDKTDRITEEIQQQKAAAQSREQLNLLYVALTRARQQLYISGVETSRSGSGWYALMRNALSSLLPDDDSPLVYSYGQQQAIANIVQQENVQQDKAETVAALQAPVSPLPATEYMIAPSRVNPHNLVDYFALNAMDTEHGQTRGIIIHRALDLLSRHRPLTIETVKQQLVAENGIDTNDVNLKNWLEEASAIVNNKLFSEIFSPADSALSYNELQLLFESNSSPVYGFIDRLVVTEDEILLIDYKTHQQAGPENITELAAMFKQQLDLYALGVQRIWPAHRIRQGLLFTACAQIVWI